MCWETTIGAATAEDAPALGRLMVESWLSAHRDQVPEEAWRERAAEWTPEVSARGWARVLTDQACAVVPRDVLLVAARDGEVVGLVYGVLGPDAADVPAEVVALYVAPARHREGVGGALLRAAAHELVRLGARSLRLSVLSVNRPARRFYEAMGGVEVGRGSVEEGGHELPSTIYEWADAAALARD